MPIELLQKAGIQCFNPGVHDLCDSKLKNKALTELVIEVADAQELRPEPFVTRQRVYSTLGAHLVELRPKGWLLLYVILQPAEKRTKALSVCKVLRAHVSKRFQTLPDSSCHSASNGITSKDIVFCKEGQPWI